MVVRGIMPSARLCSKRNINWDIRAGLPIILKLLFVVLQICFFGRLLKLQGISSLALLADDLPRACPTGDQKLVAKPARASVRPRSRSLLVEANTGSGELRSGTGGEGGHDGDHVLASLVSQSASPTVGWTLSMQVDFSEWHVLRITRKWLYLLEAFLPWYWNIFSVRRCLAVTCSNDS